MNSVTERCLLPYQLEDHAHMEDSGSAADWAFRLKLPAVEPPLAEGDGLRRLGYVGVGTCGAEHLACGMWF